MILKRKIVTLRPIEESDLEFLQQMTNSSELEETIVGWSWPVSMKDQRQWYQNFRNSDSFSRYIIETEEDGVVGLTGLRNIDWKNGTAETAGIRIYKTGLRGKGIAKDAYMTLLRFVFEELRLNRISASSLACNIISQRFMQKCGFKQEGVIREAVFKKGTYQDKVLFGCLKSDYEELLKTHNYWNISNLTGEGKCLWISRLQQNYSFAVCA